MLKHFLSSFFVLLEQHSFLVYVSIFLISFIEFIFIVGNLFPGTTIIFLFSFLASQENYNLFFLLLSAYLGSIMGDFVSYIIGKRYGEYILKRFHLVKEEREYERKYLNKNYLHEGKWISFFLLGKLNSFIRSFTGFVSGMKNFSFKLFLAFSFIGSGLWACVCVVLPYMLGNIAKRYTFYINIGAFVVICLLMLVISIADGSFYDILKYFKDVKK